MKVYEIAEPGKGVGAWKIVERKEASPGESEVVVRVKATSLNYRDLMVAKGSYGKKLNPNTIPLSDGAGEVVAVGNKVTRVRTGDRVAASFFQRWISGPIQGKDHSYALGGTIDGMLAQQVLLHESGVVKFPDHLSYEEAATLPCAAVTAWNAMMESRTPLKPGSTLLTLGTGGVSVFAAQFGKAAGFRVIGTSGSDAKLERLREFGVTDGINYKTTPEWQDEVKRLTDGNGVDQVIEVGGAGTLPRSLQSVRYNGTVSLIGVLTGISSDFNPFGVVAKSVNLQGIYVGSVEMFENLNRALAVRQIHPVIDEVFSFADANRALAKMESGAHFGKIVVRID